MLTLPRVDINVNTAPIFLTYIVLPIDSDTNVVPITLVDGSGGNFKFERDSRKLKIEKLRPGHRYDINILNPVALSVVGVASCSCDASSPDNTGRPNNFSIRQDGGHVMFEFRDNSHCEEAFSFTRVANVGEFQRDFQEEAVSFVNDFYFSSQTACNAKIDPGRRASDDLLIRYVC